MHWAPICVRKYRKKPISEILAEKMMYKYQIEVSSRQGRQQVVQLTYRQRPKHPRSMVHRNMQAIGKLGIGIVQCSLGAYVVTVQRSGRSVQVDQYRR